MTAIPKPEKRIQDPDVVQRKVASDPVCRICSRRASDGHHILLRSQGGDDVEENVLPLCHSCHMAYHAGRGTLKLKKDEFQYILGKLGREAGLEYLRRRRIVR